MEKQPLGLYIHIPYCIHKCGYCDFNSHPIKHDEMDHYIDVRVKMKGIDEVKFGEIHQVNPLELTNANLDWVLHVMERDRIHRVEGVFTVELSREPVHHHYHLTRRRTALRRIDDESSVEAFVNMSL